MKKVGDDCGYPDQGGVPCPGQVGEGGRCSYCGHKYFDITLHDETCAHMYTVTQKNLAITLKSEDMPEKMFASAFQTFVEKEDE